MLQQDLIHLTPTHLAKRWSVTVAHLANQRSAGIGPNYLKLGGRVLYRLADIETYEERSLIAGGKA